ncbi:hypothetical protein CMI37_12265 [Candidatus Pacearchaeota archaeon]|nr:hypothetical protein [Candidatus Pacearchaeota archaeon]|tara:strand:+ start:3398 stop:3778 length:381 start_codon:yes stop_codon:yes gene_type:complete
MTKLERLKLAVETQDFYHERCVPLEEQIDKDVKYIVNVDHEEWSKERIEKALEDCQNLMIVSGKFVNEAENVLNILSSLTREEYESNVELVGEVAVSVRATMKHQKKIYNKLIELQAILIEIIERF